MDIVKECPKRKFLKINFIKKYIKKIYYKHRMFYDVVTII